jgi:sugar O-acyltransferase (sialic acid O-acetyltransferase NeuD family)
MRILIFGAGGQGQVVADVLRSAAAHGGSARPCGFLDHDAALWGQTVLELPVLGSIDDWPRFDHDAAIVGVGDNLARRRLFRNLALRGEPFATALHPAAVIAANVVIGRGSVACAGVVVNTGASVGANVILNTGCSVDHHDVIGDHAHIAPGVRLGGRVTVGEGALVGIGAVVMPGCRVGAWSVVGAGAVVTDDVPDRAVVVGCPARTHEPELPARAGAPVRLSAVATRS